MSRRSLSNTFLLIVFGTLCWACVLWAQQAERIIGEGKDASEMPGMGPIVMVSHPGEGIRQLWAYADPTDARHLIACGMFDDKPANSSYGYVYSSSDGGASWHRTLLDNATRWVSEENCAFGKDGRAYFAAGESDTSTGFPRHEWGHLQLYFSQDHGETWKPAGRREFVDWTILVALPTDKLHPEKLAIFGNNAADREGHWSGRRPVAFDVSDSGNKFSELAPVDVSTTANFGGGGVGMPDGTALFLVSVTGLKNADDASLHRQLNVYAYDSSAHSFGIRSTLRDVIGRTEGIWSMLARDTSKRFPGRLYAAWSDFKRTGVERDAQLWLGTSDDNGYHWRSRPIFLIPDFRISRGCPRDIFGVQPDIRIAVNDKGVLGVLWTLNGRTMQFAQSLDGGRTFRTSSLVVDQPQSDLALDDGVNFNEWGLAEHFASARAASGQELRKYFDPTHLGLSVRLSRHFPIGDFALAPGAGSKFQALWTATGSNGYSVMTRSIDSARIPNVSSAATAELMAANIPASPCEAGTDELKAQQPTLIADLQVSGQTDISSSLNLHVDHVDYSSESHVVTATVSLASKEASSLRPVSLVALGLHSDFGVPTPLNADGTVQGQPSWNITSVAANGGAKASSKPIQLQFKIDQFHEVQRGDVVAMQIRIFADDTVYPAVTRLSQGDPRP